MTDTEVLILILTLHWMCHSTRTDAGDGDPLAPLHTPPPPHLPGTPPHWCCPHRRGCRGCRARPSARSCRGRRHSTPGRTAHPALGQMPRTEGSGHQPHCPAPPAHSQLLRTPRSTTALRPRLASMTRPKYHCHHRWLVYCCHHHRHSRLH